MLFAYGDPPLFAAILAFFILAAALVRSDRALSTAAGSLLAWEVQWCVCLVGQVGVRCVSWEAGVCGGRQVRVRCVSCDAGGSEESGSGGCEVWCS